MKVCQICKSRYEDEQTFCFNDGSVLVSFESEISEATLNLPTNKVSDWQTLENNRQPNTNPANYGKPRQVKRKNTLLILGLLTVLLLPIVGITAGIIYLSRNYSPENESPRITENPTPKRQLGFRKGEIKVEIQEKVKGSFGRQYLRCLVTNVSDGVIENVRISLNLYNNDIKGDDAFSFEAIDFLKPNQTLPVWIDVTNSKFTRAEFADAPLARISEKDEKELFPTLIYTDVKMSQETLTSMYNFKKYPEVFYEVKGIVTNNDYDKLNPKIYVYFYDENKQIVGIRSTYPPELKRGEKAEFEVSAGETQLFGKPKSYEIFAVQR
jgi:hypothetical protein